MSDINDTKAAAGATAAEGKSAPQARRNAATQGAPRARGSRTAKQGRAMLGAEAVIASLEAEGVTTVFGYPGGQAIKLYDALYDSDQITHVLARHEQGAVHMADGYARSTGRAGVAIVTSGPGATNTVTGIATAYMDSVPLVIITGQVGRGVIGTDSFQESDIVGITMPRGQALLPAAIHRRAHPHHPRGLPHRRHRAPRAPCSSTSRAMWPARLWCFSTRTR